MAGAYDKKIEELEKRIESGRKEIVSMKKEYDALYQSKIEPFVGIIKDAYFAGFKDCDFGSNSGGDYELAYSKSRIKNYVDNYKEVK